MSDAPKTYPPFGELPSPCPKCEDRGADEPPLPIWRASAESFDPSERWKAALGVGELRGAGFRLLHAIGANKYTGEPARVAWQCRSCLHVIETQTADAGSRP